MKVSRMSEKFFQNFKSGGLDPKICTFSVLKSKNDFFQKTASLILRLTIIGNYPENFNSIALLNPEKRLTRWIQTPWNAFWENQWKRQKMQLLKAYCSVFQFFFHQIARNPVEFHSHVVIVPDLSWSIHIFSKNLFHLTTSNCQILRYILRKCKQCSNTPIKTWWNVQNHSGTSSGC